MAQYPPILSGANGLLYGADYNPEQWIRVKDLIWKRDMELAKEAHLTELTVGIFSWSMLEPTENDFRFDWLDDVMDMLHQNGIRAILATPGGARPPWLAQAYPEVLRVNASRQRVPFGGRHNHCFTSPAYRERVRIIGERLAERYKAHPALGMWHLNNEYSGECHCPLCQAAFRQWLQKRYGDIDTLNDAWWNTFWSKRYTDFAQIESPSPIGETESHGLTLSWRRFCSDQTVDFCRAEAEPMRRITPQVPVTHNMMSTCPSTDYFALGRALDRSSWDAYPDWTDTNADVGLCWDYAFRHDLMRGVGGQKPFLLMESCPTTVNWHPVDKLRRPGTLFLQGMQAVAHGSDSVQYFQFRKSRGQTEKFHGAILDHAGTDQTRVFREVEQVGAALGKLACVAGTAPDSRVALVYDWENRWALEDARCLYVSADKGYEETVRTHHSALCQAGLSVDLIDQTCPLAPYKLVVAPMCYLLRAGFAERLTAFAQAGGAVVLTYVSGWVDENDLCYLGGFPGPLRKLAGVWAEEDDVLLPGEHNRLTFGGRVYPTREINEILHTQGAEALSVYEGEFYAGEPALTRNAYGKGLCYYIAARTEADFLRALYASVAREASLPVAPFDCGENVGVTTRVGDSEDSRVWFLLNYGRAPERIRLSGRYLDLLTDEALSGELTLPVRGVRVLRAL